MAKSTNYREGLAELKTWEQLEAQKNLDMIANDIIIDRIILNYQSVESQKLQNSVFEYIDKTNDWYENLITSKKWKQLGETKSQEILDVLLTEERINRMALNLNDYNFANRLILAIEQQNQALQGHIFEYARQTKRGWGKLNKSTHWLCFKQRHPEKIDFIAEQIAPDCLKDPGFITDYIRDQIQKGRNREETFVALYREFFDDMKDTDSYKLKQWFDKLNGNNERQINYTDYDLLFFRKLAGHIKQKFQLAERVISAKTCCNTFTDHFCFVSERYALDIQYRKDDKCYEVFLFDILNHERRSIEIDNDLKIKSHFKLVNLHSNYFLLVDFNLCVSEKHFSCIYFMKLNVEEFKCYVVDKKVMQGTYYQCVVDSEDKNNFIVLIQHGDFKYIHKGSISNFKLQFGAKALKFNYSDYSYFKLAGNKLLGMNAKLVSLHEFIIESNQIQFQRLCSITNNFLRQNVNSYKWIDENCYIFQHTNNMTCLLKYNYEEKRIDSIRYFKAENTKSCDILIENGTLSFCTWNGEINQHSFYRFSLTQPDTLSNLTMRLIQDQLMFANAETYDKFIQENVPQKLRPFGHFN